LSSPWTRIFAPSGHWFFFIAEAAGCRRWSEGMYVLRLRGDRFRRCLADGRRAGAAGVPGYGRRFLYLTPFLCSGPVNGRESYQAVSQDGRDKDTITFLPE
jgi:hypothetical protein